MTGDEIIVEGVSYIPSRKAAEECGYTQDYVGQLCRKGLIEAKRMGGLWYINLESLKNYKKTADSYVPVAPRRQVSQDSTTIDLGGKKYITASLAAEKVGYHSDYVGQLARGGTISAHRIGDRWLVEEEGLRKHKEEKDSLLAEVQTISTGVRDKNLESTSDRRTPKDPHFTYYRNEHQLFPNIEKRESNEEVKIIIRRPEISSKNERIYVSRINEIKTNRKSRLIFSSIAKALIGIVIFGGCLYLPISVLVGNGLTGFFSIEVLYRSSNFSF